MSSLTKKQLIETLAGETGLTQTTVNTLINAYSKTIRGAIKKGQKVTLPELGSFSIVQRKARAGRNPATGEKIKIAAKKVVKFSPAKPLRDAAAVAKLKKQ